MMAHLIYRSSELRKTEALGMDGILCIIFKDFYIIRHYCFVFVEVFDNKSNKAVFTSSVTMKYQRIP